MTSSDLDLLAKHFRLAAEAAQPPWLTCHGLNNATFQMPPNYGELTARYQMLWEIARVYERAAAEARERGYRV